LEVAIGGRIPALVHGWLGPDARVHAVLDARPFDRMPIDDQHAFGGLDHKVNPRGKGDKARQINKMIKEKGAKGVSSQTQGESVRVTGKKRDDLQAVISMLKGADLEIPLQFENFRD